jgi:predicted MFS family arabinose efflux permease
VYGKIIPVGRRGLLSGLIGCLSGILGLGVAIILQHLLSGPNDGFPNAFGRTYLIGSIIFILACVPFCFFREPVHHEAAADPHAGHILRDGLAVWREHGDFRRFLCAQIFMVLATLATPFFILHAKQDLSAGPRLLAGYSASMLIAQAVGSISGGIWSDRAGNRALLIMAIIGILLANTCALMVKSPTLFYSVFIFTFMSSYCFGMASNNIVMEFAPRTRDTALYTTINNCVMAFPRTTAPLIGGFIAQTTGDYRILFATAMALALIGLALTVRVSEPRRLQTPCGLRSKDACSAPKDRCCAVEARA